MSRKTTMGTKRIFISDREVFEFEREPDKIDLFLDLDYVLILKKHGIDPASAIARERDFALSGEWFTYREAAITQEEDRK